MKIFSSFRSHVLFKSFIALAIYPLLSSFLSDELSQEKDNPVSHGDPMSLKTPPLPFEDYNPLVNQLHSMRILSLNYFAFLLLMLVIDSLPLKAIFQHFRKAKHLAGGIPSKVNCNWRQEIIQTVIVSTIVYCFYQIVIGDLNVLFCSVITSTSCFGKEVQSYRLLEGIEPITNYESEQTERISLSLGKVLSSMNIQASHIVVTKDLKYAFVTLFYHGALKVIDISNLAAPNVVKTLSLMSQIIFVGQKFMHLSPDEKTLFLSCFEYLEIVDVTSPEFAYSQALVLDKKFRNVIGQFGNARLSLSFALSADSKTLFIGGLGLQTFDISDLKNPILLNSQVNAPIDEGYSLLSIAATADKKTLWVANGTLDSYDISDARDMKLINSFSDPNISISSLVLSDDKETAFGLGMTGIQKIKIAKLNISNPVSPLRTQLFSVAQTSPRPAFILSLSQKHRYLFIAAETSRWSYRIVVFDLIEKRVMLSNDQSLLTNMTTVTTLSRENFLLTSGPGKMTIIQFYKDFPNREIFSLTDYPTWKMNMTNKYNNIEFSQGEKNLFVLSSGESSKSLLEIYDFQNKTSPDLLSSLKIDFLALSIAITADGKRAGLFNNQKIGFYDTSNLGAPSFYSKYNVEGDLDIEEVAFWSESNIVFLVIHTFQLNKKAGEFRVIDLSDPKSPSVLYEIALPGREEQSYKMAFSQNKTLIFLAGPVLCIYNSSDISSVHQIGSVNIKEEETEYVDFAQVSHDDKTIFVEIVDRSSFHKLKIYDVSDARNPKFAAELILPMQVKNFLSQSPMLSADSKTLYFLQKQDILAVDVSIRGVPRIFALLPIGNIYQEEIVQVKLSGDDRTMYFVTKNGTIHSMSLPVPQTLFLNQEEFYIGQQYSDSPMVLKLEKGSEYTLMEGSEYLISKIGIFEVKVDATAQFATSSLKLLPSWARFDQTSRMLTLEPRKQTDLGYYTLFAIISNKVSVSTFSFLDPENITGRANYLISELVARGYLDKQHFLTSEIGPLKEFYLPTYFRDSEKEQIYRKLNEYYIVTCTTINILPSLKVDQQIDKLSILSPNLDFVKINIQLEDITHANFLKRSYGSLFPVISNNKSHLMIEGPLKEVNTALGNITVDLENIEGCAAEMTVIDDMNPPVTVNLRNIKEYFRVNKAPYPNPKKSIQKQIDIVPVYTGQYFTITLDRNTIIDKNIDLLNYKLVSKGGEANDTIPSWMTFDDLTIRGTAPEELLDRDIEFTLIASNEFKKIEVPFKLHLKISSTYILKLIMKYSPYILTIIGLYIKANKIYNILGKKIYRHKKDFFVEIGSEITNEVIFPIAFIQEEKKEIDIIWRHFVKKIPKHGLDESTDKEKVLKLIRETVKSDIPKELKKKLKVYFYGVNSRKKIINQLVINKLVHLKLNSKEEKSTKMIFEKLKDKWIELVDWDSSSEYFKTNIDKLYEELVATQDITRDSGDIEENLLSKSKLLGVNLSLLSNALEAYTFDCHSIDRLAIRCNVQLKEKTEKNCLQSLFKLDIESINHNSRLQEVYGLNWKFENDSLVFAGVPCENFKKRTLVIEIATGQHKILKEIWIHEKSMDTEVEAEEQHYEVL